MSRHFWQACNREAGLSFVELLVTIIIAGIAFAAMVPVFVQAAQTKWEACTATPGDGLVQLDWIRPTAGDLDHYEIYRTTNVDVNGEPVFAGIPSRTVGTWPATPTRKEAGWL